MMVFARQLQSWVGSLILFWILIDLVTMALLSVMVMPPNIQNMIVIFDTGLCAVLFLEFIFKLCSLEDKKEYFMENRKGVVLDVFAMVPYELLMCGPLGFLRFILILSLLGKVKKDILPFIEKTKMNYTF